jgi:cytochrome b6-f complex iron-sulfur subunit
MALSRRGFLMTGFAFFAAGCGRSSDPPRDITLRRPIGPLDEGDAPVYLPEARGYIVRYPAASLDEARQVYGDDVLVGMELGLTAFSQKCTHLGCRVPFCETSQWFECPCHATLYNRVGEVMGGPAERGLDRLILEVDEAGDLFIVGDPVDGPPEGTDTIGQDPEGPHCIGGGVGV